MYEIRIHGRGGQGVRMTAHILGRAAFLSGFQTQDFAVYGAERRGAPVASFCRLDKEEILTRGYIFHPDAVIVLDDTIKPDTALQGIKGRGLVLVNSSHEKESFAGARFIDATKIALEEVGMPIPNAAILGAFLKVSRLFPLENLKKAVKTELELAGHKEAVQGNLKALERCYRAV